MKLHGRLVAAGAAVLVAAVTAVVVLTTSSERPASTRSHGNLQVDEQPSAGDSRSPGSTQSNSLAPSNPATKLVPVPTATPDPNRGPLHFVANVGSQVPAVQALGFNLLDTGSDPSTINALPPGVLALVWLGSLDNHDCALPGYPFDAFTKAVDRLTGNPKVFGYFLADEPHPKDCPTTVADLRERADYIRAHDPTHRSFVVVLDGSNQCGGTYGCEFAAMAPSKTHVDLIGVDPYPCNTSNAASGCAYQKIDDTVQHAEQNGVPKSVIVPVFQLFGQACAASAYYRLPSVAELHQMYARWAALVPRPVFDYAYTWARQGSACPTLSDADGANGYPDLQSVVRQHNLG